MISGLVLFFFLPSGGGRGGSWATYLGIARDPWVTMHNYTSLAFTALLILHLLLHGNFFKNIGRILTGKEKDRTET